MRAIIAAAAFAGLASAAAADITGKARPIDGDTLEIAGARIRLFAIDAPALDQTCTAGARSWRCGEEAMFALANAMLEHWVRCEEKGRAADGALVAVCYVGPYDLGARMAYAFADTLDGCRPMLLIGTDCPAQTIGDLAAALTALEAADAVVQPAEDGGYVLVGMRQPHAALFESIAWGGDTVLAATRTRAAEQGVRLAELPMCWDLDRSEDLDRALALGLVVLDTP